jgi:cytochrome c oxidase subunit IV
MENNEFKNLWVEVDGMLTPKSPDELKQILGMKAKKILKRYGTVTLGSIILCVAVVAFSIAGIIKHASDAYYVINNILLSLVTMVYLVYYLILKRKLSYSVIVKLPVLKSIQNVWYVLSGVMKRKIEMILALFLGLFLMLAIHRYFESTELLSLLKDEETIWGLLLGIAVAAITGVFIFRELHKYFGNELQILNHYIDQLKSF